MSTEMGKRPEERRRAVRDFAREIRQMAMLPTGAMCGCGKPATLGERPAGSQEAFRHLCTGCYLVEMVPKMFPK